MRGHVSPQSHLFSYFSPEERVAATHPLRSIKAYTDAALAQIRPLLDGLSSETGRPSIPPERLLKAQLLIALYSVRSDRLFCETLDYNILFRWFLDMGLEEASFDASTFSKNRGRLAQDDVALKFFDAVECEARGLDLLSDEHFRGEERRNDSHASSTDPEAKLLRKGPGKEAKLCFAGHALMDNRHGLITDVSVTLSVGVTEPQAALALLARQRRKHLQPVSIGADKGYHRQQFVSALKAKHIRPHIACIEGCRTAGLDQRTLGSPAYRASQIVRKRIEQFFGWGKTTGGLRKTRLHGVERNAQLLWLIGSAYNLLRMSRM